MENSESGWEPTPLTLFVQVHILQEIVAIENAAFGKSAQGFARPGDRERLIVYPSDRELSVDDSVFPAFLARLSSWVMGMCREFRLNVIGMARKDSDV